MIVVISPCWRQKKKTSDARKCSRKKFMMNEGVEKIIVATLNSPKNSPPHPIRNEKVGLLILWQYICLYFFVLFCFVFFFLFLIICTVDQFRRKKTVFFLKHQVTLIFFVYEKYHDTSFCILVYNYPERRSNKYVALFTDPERDSCFSVHQISWIKIKKAPFSELKTSLIRNFVYNFQTFRGFCQEHFYNFAAN